MLRRILKRAVLPTVAVTLAMGMATAPAAHAEDAEPVGDPRYTVRVDPDTGRRIYTPVDLVTVDAVPRSAQLSEPPTGVFVWDEDLAVLGVPDVGAGTSLADSGGDSRTWAPFEYSFSFKRYVDGRFFYTHKSRVCIDQLASATPSNTSRPVKYTTSLVDDHGNFDVIVGEIRFTANVGAWTGYCFSGIDTSNKYYLWMNSPDNNNGKITGQGNVQND